MRDGQIYSSLDDANKRIATIYRQLVFIDTRLQALEIVAQRPWALFQALFKPRAYILRVDSVHLALMRKHDEEMKQARQEQKAKPKLTLVGANGAIK